MAAFNNVTQKMVTHAGVRAEYGFGAVIVSGQTNAQNFTVATKLKKVLGGFGTMVTDQMVAIPDTGIVSNGQVTWRREGPIVTDADTIMYSLFGY